MSIAQGNQTLGRGKVYFSLFKDGTQTPAGYRYVGNTPSFSLNIANTNLDHFSSDNGVKVKDKSIVLQTDGKGSMECDDIQLENLSLFFFGSFSTLSQTSGTAVSEAFTAVNGGQMYQLGVTDGNPAGVRSISNVVVSHTSTTYVVNTDYTVDATRGTVTIVKGGSITDGSPITVVYDRAAKSRDQVISGEDQVEGALMFQSHNPEGADMDYLMPYVRLSPNGDYNLKGDDWLKLGLSVEILQGTNRERIYLNGMPY